jgi:hypothetical protein
MAHAENHRANVATTNLAILRPIEISHADNASRSISKTWLQAKLRTRLPCYLEFNNSDWSIAHTAMRNSVLRKVETLAPQRKSRLSAPDSSPITLMFDLAVASEAVFEVMLHRHTRVAGNGIQGFRGDGESARNASVGHPARLPHHFVSFRLVGARFHPCFRGAVSGFLGSVSKLQQSFTAQG